MTSVLKAYQQQRTVAWTRIEMLIALYDEAINRIGKAITQLHEGRADASVAEIVRAERIVLELLDGLDLSHGEIPEMQQRLLIHVVDCLLSRETVRLEASVRVLTTLREGFQGIREEAIELERRGEIPPADENRLLDATA